MIAHWHRPSTSPIYKARRGRKKKKENYTSTTMRENRKTTQKDLNHRNPLPFPSKLALALKDRGRQKGAHSFFVCTVFLSFLSDPQLHHGPEFPSLLFLLFVLRCLPIGCKLRFRVVNGTEGQADRRTDTTPFFHPYSHVEVPFPFPNPLSLTKITAH